MREYTDVSQINYQIIYPLIGEAFSENYISVSLFHTKWDNKATKTQMIVK